MTGSSVKVASVRRNFERSSHLPAEILASCLRTSYIYCKFLIIGHFPLSVKATHFPNYQVIKWRSKPPNDFVIREMSGFDRQWEMTDDEEFKPTS